MLEGESVNNFDKLFEQLKETRNWEGIYQPLRNATKGIVGQLKTPTIESDDVLHNVLLRVLPKLDSITHVGYILQSIKREAYKNGKQHNRNNQVGNENQNVGVSESAGYESDT
jgi:hypothetical protein